MTETQFINGWNYVYKWYNRSVNDDHAHHVYTEAFTRKDGTRFMAACKNITRKYDYLPKNLGKAILDEMADITYGILREAREGCNKCEEGLIHFKLLYNGAVRNTVGACNCPDGKEISDETNVNRIPPFFIGPIATMGLDEYTYKTEIVVVETTPDEAIEKKYWYQLCKIRGWSQDKVRNGEIPSKARILLTLEDAVSLGVDGAKKLKEDLDSQEDLAKQFAQKGVNKQAIVQEYIQKITKKNEAVKADLDKAAEEARTQKEQEIVEAEKEESESLLPSDDGDDDELPF